jgi:hypothetical protein
MELNELYFWTLSIVWCLKKIKDVCIVIFWYIYILIPEFFETPDDG